MEDVTALPKGEWDAELPRFIKSKKMVVLLHDLKSDTIEKEFILDYGNYEHRKFLGKLTYYAIANCKSVETMDVDDWNRMKV